MGHHPVTLPHLSQLVSSSLDSISCLNDWANQSQSEAHSQSKFSESPNPFAVQSVTVFRFIHLINHYLLSELLLVSYLVTYSHSSRLPLTRWPTIWSDSTCPISVWVSDQSSMATGTAHKCEQTHWEWDHGVIDCSFNRWAYTHWPWVWGIRSWPLL